MHRQDSVISQRTDLEQPEDDENRHGHPFEDFLGVLADFGRVLLRFRLGLHAFIEEAHVVGEDAMEREGADTDAEDKVGHQHAEVHLDEGEFSRNGADQAEERTLNWGWTEGHDRLP